MSLRAVAAGLACLAACAPAAAAAPELSLELELDPASRRFAATAELDRPAGRFAFALHESLSVASASSGPARLSVRSRALGKSLRAWSVAMPAAGKLRIEYGGTLPALDPALDHRGVLRALPPMAAAQGSFLPASSGWYPAPGKPFTYRVRLSLPASQKGLVAGRLASETGASGRYGASFEYDHPAEGIDLMAGPYDVRERLVTLSDGSKIRLRTYFFADLASLAEGYLDDSARYLALYASAIGPYPFTEFSIVASPLPTGFGMPTLTYLGASVLKLPFIRASSLGHEVLHNWWGNGVLVDYAAGNWSEGLTTFMADYAYKERESPGAAREMRLGWLRDLAAAPPTRTLASFSSREHGADAVVGYGKAAMLFFMLRDTIGQAAFDAALRRFWAEQRFRSASWSDLRHAFERSAGRSLERFFTQWLQRTGAPAVRVVEARASEAGVRVTLEQAAPAYALRVPVEVSSSAGAETHLVEFDRERQTFDLKTGASAEAVRLDPELRLWRLLAREELPPILRQWFTSRAPRVALASTDAAARAAALGLAARVLESPFAEVPAEGALAADILLVGLHPDIDAVLARLGLPERPPALADKGTAQVWTIARQKDGKAVAVVSARDAAALESLMRPLPHYGSQSYLAFEGARAIERGIWPGAPRSVPVTR